MLLEFNEYVEQPEIYDKLNSICAMASILGYIIKCISPKQDEIDVCFIDTASTYSLSLLYKQSYFLEKRVYKIKLTQIYKGSSNRSWFSGVTSIDIVDGFDKDNTLSIPIETLAEIL